MAKYDTNGKLIWSRLAGNDQGQSGHNIAVGPTGDCYISGYVSGIVTLSNRKFGSPTRTKDIFVTRMNPAGEVGLGDNERW